MRKTKVSFCLQPAACADCGVLGDTLQKTTVCLPLSSHVALGHAQSQTTRQGRLWCVLATIPVSQWRLSLFRAHHHILAHDGHRRSVCLSCIGHMNQQVWEVSEWVSPLSSLCQLCLFIFHSPTTHTFFFIKNVALTSCINIKNTLLHVVPWLQLQ